MKNMQLKNQGSKAVFIEELEPRLLLSAGLEAFIISDNTIDAAALQLPVTEASTLPELSTATNTATAAVVRHELVFVDESVPDYEQVISDLKANADEGRMIDIIMLDNSEDGIEQISTALQDYQDIDAVHVISHGSGDAVQLGNTWLSLDTISGYSDSIHGWESALSNEADLLFYGCDLASSDEGQALLGNISLLSGADVAASNDLTGNARLGGDWDLEYNVGTIESTVAVSEKLQANWSSVLADTLPPFQVNNNGSTVVEGGTDSITNPELRYDDDKKPPTQVVYTLTSGPSDGQLELTTTPGVPIVSFTQDDIDSNRLIYIHNGADNLTDSFNFDVDDTSGNVLVGQSFTITVTPVNDTPTAANNTVTANEDVPYAFTLADFNFSDPDIGDTLNQVRITALESIGSLQLSGADVLLNQVISAADISAGNLTFTPASDASGLGYDSFDFEVHDGTLFSAASYTMTIDVTAVNDAPTSTNNTVTTNEDTAYAFGLADFNFSDIDIGDTLNQIRITALESVGSLQLSGVDVTLNQVISAADISAGNLTFTAAANANGLAHDTFDFEVHDGTAFSAASYTITIDVTAVADAPTATSNTVTTSEESNYIFNLTDFNFSDGDIGDTLNQIRITALESVGSLQLSGVDVALNQVISAADISAGNLIFTPAPNGNGPAYDSFDYQVHDGTAFSAASYTMTVDVNPVNDAPTASNVSATFSNNVTYTVALADLNINDVDGDTPAISGFTQPGNGTVTDNGDNTWTYTPNNGFVGTDSFVFTIDDGNSGITTAMVNMTVASTVATVNDSEVIEVFNQFNQTATQPVTETIISQNSETQQSEIVETTTSQNSESQQSESTRSENSDGDTGNSGEETDNDESNTNASFSRFDSEKTTLSINNLRTLNSLAIAAVLNASDNSLIKHNNAQNKASDDLEIIQKVLGSLSPTISSQEFENILSKRLMINNVEFMNDIDHLKKQISELGQEQTKSDKISAGVATGTSVALSAGLLSSVLRGGSLLTSFLSVMPLWKGFDPLPVVNAVAKKNEEETSKEENTDDETLLQEEVVEELMDVNFNKRPDS